MIKANPHKRSNRNQTKTLSKLFFKCRTEKAKAQNMSQFIQSIIMMVDYPAVKQLLQDIEHPAKAKFVAEDIEKHTQDPRFISLLQVAIKDPQLTSNTQLAGAVVLSKVINQMYSQWDEQIIVQALMGIITDMHVDHRIKMNFQLNLTSILQTGTQELFVNLLMKAAELLFMGRQLTNMQIGSDNTAAYIEYIKTAILILRCLANSHAHFSIFKKALVQEFLEPTLCAVKGFTVKEMNTMISLAEFWREVLEKARAGGTKEHFQVLSQLSGSPRLIEWVFFIYHHEYLAGQQCFFNPNSDSDHEHIANLKVAAANLHKQILFGLEFAHTMHQELTKRQLSQLTGMINTVCIFISFKQKCEPYQDFMIELIGIIILIVKLFHKELNQTYDRLLHMIAFPLLAITEEEQQLFDDDASEFNNLAQDCCDKQSYGILKTEAARLVQTICDEIQSAATYTIQHAIISIKVRFSPDPNLNQGSQHFLNLEQALTVLAILSYRIGKHQVQLKEIRSILNVEDVKDKVNPLQMTRIFQFLAYNFQELFPHYLLGQKWVNLALFVSVEQAQKFPTLAYSALDFISNVFQNCFIESVAIKYIQYNNYSKNYEIRYKILQKLLTKYYMKFSDQGLSLALKKLLFVILIDLQNYQKNVKSHTMDIAHSLHTCRKIAQKPQRIRQGSQVRARIWEIISHLELFRKIHLDDEIVKIAISVVKCQGVTPQVNLIIPIFMQIFREDYSQSAYIVFINEVAIRMADPIGIFYPLLEAATHMHCKVLETPTSVTENLALGNILLVLQHILLVFGEKMSVQALRDVVQSCLHIIPAQDYSKVKIEPAIIARALNLLFICHIYRADEMALRKMLQFSDALLFRGHDLNVLALILTKELFRQPDMVSVTQMIILLVNSIWKARYYQPQIKSKKNPKIQIKSSVIKIHKISNYEASLKSMTKPFANDLVPQIQLRQALSKMSSNNHQLYQTIINSLPNKVRQNMRQIFLQITIQGRKRKIFRPGTNKLISESQVISSSTSTTVKRIYVQSQEQVEQENIDEEETSFKKGLMKKKRIKDEKSSANL